MEMKGIMSHALRDNYEKILALAGKVFDGYEGSVIEENGRISLVGNNMVDGRRAECKVSIGLLNCREFPFCVDGEERSSSSIGGCGCPCTDLEEAEEEINQILVRYRFAKKRQMSLFDFQ